jgi:hypothetical protein
MTLYLKYFNIITDFKSAAEGINDLNVKILLPVCNKQPHKILNIIYSVHIE